MYCGSINYFGIEEWDLKVTELGVSAFDQSFLIRFNIILSNTDHGRLRLTVHFERKNTKLIEKTSLARSANRVRITCEKSTERGIQISSISMYR